MTITQEALDELCAIRVDRARPTGLCTETWYGVRTMIVPVSACLPTQRVAQQWVAEYVAKPGRGSYIGDPYGHIVVDEGRWLIEDGHHRWAAAVMTGKEFWVARVFVHPSAFVSARTSNPLKP